MAKKQPEWNSPKMQRSIRQHDAKSYKQRQGQRYNTKPPKGGCAVVIGAVLSGLVGAGATVRGWL